MKSEMGMIESNLPVENKNVENKKITLEVLDNRKQNIPSRFNLDEFLVDLNILMTDETLFKNKKSNYGKYFQYATAESDHFADSLREAKAIRVTIDNGGMLYQRLGKDRTVVTIDTIISNTEGRRTMLNFDENAKYLSGSQTRNMRGKLKIENNIDSGWELISNSQN